ncbi:nuclease-related domain-containing protein [Parahalioglobus pacificus]|uniref:DNA-binding protein n=1 Tax=Parahalioglobus pacificus TaxID=930806 RepID=A0A919CJI3_9GAMM|nr:NERD domain-containing protein [Halioglobus pacificus]GHD30042.1 DNA-binding protein [Halioglobus pacificus]
MDILETVTSTWLFHLWWLIPLVLFWRVIDSAWFKGKVGEWAVANSFTKYLNSDEYTVLHDITLPTEKGTTQIDHIVLSQFGIFVIETKNYSGWIFGNTANRTWTQTFHRTKFKFQNPLWQNAKHVKAVAATLQLPSDSIHSVIIFTGTAQFRTPMPPNVTCRAGGVMHIRTYRSPIYSSEQVAQMIDAIEKARHTPGFKTNIAHVRQIKENAAATPSCPKCDIPMTLRTAKKGAKAGNQFWGCSNFPKCRYTRPV